LTDEKRLKKAVFYLDESIYSRALDSAMQAAGANVRRVGADVPYGSPDEVWLEIVGKKYGYIPPVYPRKNGTNKTSCRTHRPMNNPICIFLANSSRPTLRNNMASGKCT
jgi:hypothetical protein